jgi:hypothetical protein
MMAGAESTVISNVLRQSVRLPRRGLGTGDDVCTPPPASVGPSGEAVRVAEFSPRD